MKTFYEKYVGDLTNALKYIDLNKLKLITKKIWEAKLNDNTIFLIGNGGSSATPSHSAGDWSKELGIKAVCLSDNIPALTAFANDTDYENIFVGQLETFLGKDDILIGYSGSGNSMNVINAINYCKEKGNYTVGITGNYKKGNGGLLNKNSDISIVIDTESMEIIEDLHYVVNHIIKEYIKIHYIID